MPKRVLVCGGRSYWDKVTLQRVLSSLDISLIISGMASGADILGWQYAKEKQIPTLEFPANWKLHGKQAGFIRNLQMLKEGKPDLVVAFPGGPGTAHTVREAKALGIQVLRVEA